MNARTALLRSCLNEVNRVLRGPFADSLQAQGLAKLAQHFRQLTAVRQAQHAHAVDTFLRDPANKIHVMVTHADGVTRKVAVNGFYPLLGMLGAIGELSRLGESERVAQYMARQGITVEWAVKEFQESAKRFYDEICQTASCAPSGA